MRHFCIVFFVMMSSVIMAKEKLPVWVTNPPVTARDSNILFSIGEATAITRDSAIYMAKCNAYIRMKERLEGAYIPSTSELQIIHEGLTKELMPDNRRCYEACRPYVIINEDKTFTAYVLYQFQKDIRVKVDFYNYLVPNYKNSMVKSAIIPGWGQISKGAITEGSLTLAGELMVLGAGTGLHLASQKEFRKMNEYGILYDDFLMHKQRYNTYRGISYACWGLGVLVYVLNLYSVYTILPKTSDISISFSGQSLDMKVAECILSFKI